MDAAADYAAIRQAMTNAHLPAYVSYVVRSHGSFDAFHGEETTTLVVRTSDGVIVSGTPPKMTVGSGEGNAAADVVRNGPFNPACYEPSSAVRATFEAQPVEAIGLRSRCRKNSVSIHLGDAARTPEPAGTGTPDPRDDSDFTTLYADLATHRPIAVVGGSTNRLVNAHLEERFTIASGYVLPSSFTVKVAGSGPMFWLNVDANQSYSDYRFLSAAP